jgi:DNA-binding NarL/FixJ family response regulator
MTTTAALDPKEHDWEELCKGKRVIICDDHPSTRLGFRDICARIGCEVVAEATTGEEALELLEVCRPDLLLLDQYLPGALDGPAVHREVRRRHLVPKVLVITSFCDSASFFDWIHQPDGPNGVLDKATGVYELKTAIIQMLTTDRKYIPDSIWYREHGDSRNPLSKLAPHELRVLRDVAQGFKLVDIARRHSLAPSTIRTYMNAIYYKLGLTSHTLQGAAALYNKWVNAGPLPPSGGSE